MISHYEALGVDRNATPQEIKNAYRQMSLKWHPDSFDRGNSPAKTRLEAEEKFKEINKAYQILSDLEVRELYNKHGENWEKECIETNESREIIIQQKAKRNILLIIKKFESCWQVTENDLDSNLWEGYDDWREKVRSLESIDELNSFRKQISAAIDKKKKEKKTIHWDKKR